DPGSPTPRNPAQGRMAGPTRVRLRGLGTEHEGLHLERKGIPFGDGPDALGHGRARWRDTVVHMRGDELERVIVTGGREEIEQRQRIGPAGDGNDRRAPDRAKASEMTAESVDERHT